MSMFSKLTGLALKALDKSGTTNQPKAPARKTGVRSCALQQKPIP
ncbi:hypothetical protein Q2T94_08540 [Paeniglutamicibacter sulfureus]|uniref:Uncharacterized protein n=1 Tax=Paeniglutamicibacter sulfureus TaxID=43666 RepID=A0ABU2BIV4_9MICC|nr:hypothetical protein [Paeniglutamicibacter sulfureus]MDO2934345.1 hypothetical protein [Paeniglutamicibacter sulfureus]MDR7358533.1 hypothetical protein [Paeniglutamicibacter sulfureus]